MWQGSMGGALTCYGLKLDHPKSAELRCKICISVLQRFFGSHFHEIIVLLLFGFVLFLFLKNTWIRAATNYYDFVKILKAKGNTCFERETLLIWGAG